MSPLPLSSAALSMSVSTSHPELGKWGAVGWTVSPPRRRPSPEPAPKVASCGSRSIISVDDRKGPGGL